MSNDADKPEVKVFKFGEESLSDVTFVVGGEEFHCHKMALAARSPYFASMFTSSFKEKNEERIEIEADPVAFKRLMEILYNGMFEDRESIFRHASTTNSALFSVAYKECMEVAVAGFWAEYCALFELADRFFVLDIVRNVFELILIANRNCEGRECIFCATKLLLSLQYQMNGYKNISKVDRSTISIALGCIDPVQNQFNFSTDAVRFLMDRP